MNTPLEDIFQFEEINAGHEDPDIRITHPLVFGLDSGNPLWLVDTRTLPRSEYVGRDKE